MRWGLLVVSPAAYRRPMGDGIARVCAVLIGVFVIAGCSFSMNGDSRYIEDLGRNGVPTGIGDGKASQLLGHDVCNDLKGGHSRDAEVDHIASGGDGDKWSDAQAETIVSYAISDLCPDQK